MSEQEKFYKLMREVVDCMVVGCVVGFILFVLFFLFVFIS